MRVQRPVYDRWQKHRRWPWRVLLILLFVTVAMGLVLFWRQRTAEAPSQPQPNHAKNSDAGIQSVEGRYLFSGTVVIARAVEQYARTSTGIDYDQPFSKFSTFNPEQYDAWEFDHECPMTLEQIPYQTQVQNTIFNCRPEFLPSMRKHFNTIIANVANNHTRDMGEEGYEETVRLLEEGGLQTIGNYSPRVKDDICEVIALPVRLQKTDKTQTKGTLPVAFCAWHYFEFDPEPDELEVIKRYARIMPVFAFVQIGVEYRSTADPRQISVAHQLIDAGAPEFVIENSTHWVQNTEAYKGKLIVYSTGNFIFDQLEYETNRGLSIDTTMTIPYDDNVAKWLALGEQCKTRHDNCLAMAEQQGLTKVKIDLKYQAVGSSTGARQITQKADPQLQTAIEERANWADTLSKLGQQ